MLGENARDVVIDHDNLVDFAEPLFGKHADGGRAASHAHAFFLGTVDDRRLARLNNYRRAAIDLEFHWLAIAEVQQGFAGRRPSCGFRR